MFWFMHKEITPNELPGHPPIIFKSFKQLTKNFTKEILSLVVI